MITSTALDCYDEYWQHFVNLQTDEATHLYQYYKKQLQILTYNQGKMLQLYPSVAGGNID